MFNHNTLQAGWMGNDHQIELELAVFNFQDEKGIFLSFLPALDVTGYGNTQEEADESLKTVLHEYFCYTTEHNTLLKDLEKHGWDVKRKQQKLYPPDLATLIRKNEDLNTILTEKDFSKKTESFSIPAFA